MNQYDPTYQDLQLQRTTTLIRNWSAHISGDKEIQEAFSLDYLSANLVEQIQRINRLKLSNDKVEEILLNYYSLFEKNKYNLVCSTIRGAEPSSLLSLFNHCIDTIQWSLEKEEEPDFEFEIHDQLTDCLVKRDNLFLIENYVRRFLIDFDKEEHKIVQLLFNQFIETLSKIDKDFNENIEVFSLTEKFCREYTKANNLLDEEVYWWLYNPIHKAEEIGAISLLSLRSFFSDKKVSDNITDIAANINANVQFSRLLLDDKNERIEQPDNIFPTYEPSVGKVFEEQEKYDYALAAKSDSQELISNGIYVLVINKKSNIAEHHWLKSVLGVAQQSKKYFHDDILKIVNDTVPRLAETQFKLPQKTFSIDLHTSSEGCAGKSIGLSIMLEYLRTTKFLERIDLAIAVTGEIEVGGDVLKVSNIKSKVQHALECGFQMIIVPNANKSELNDDFKDNPVIKYISNVKEAVCVIRRYGKDEIKLEEKPLLELSRWISVLKEHNFETSEIKKGEWNDSISVTGFGEKVQVIIDRKKSGVIGKPRLQGNTKTRIYKEISKLLDADIVSADPSASNQKVSGRIIILGEDTRQHLQEFLKTNFNNEIQDKTEQSCIYRYDIGKPSKIVVKQYINGTLLVEGFDGELWNKVKSAIELRSGQKFEVSQKIESKKFVNLTELPSDITTWIGVDESGKGDYFGPLVTAAVLVDNFNKSKLSSIGIKDSKNLTDQKNIELGLFIQEICGDKCYVLITMPEKYNELIASPSFKGNSQRILGWQHRRVIENILLKYECQYAICDQFGNESFINEGLKTGKGSKINIIQRPKAESNLAVAAASILARREFLLRLQKMSEEYQVSFPKGASDTKTIVSVAEILIKKFGKDILTKVAKTHFKTTKIIMDTISKK